MTFEEFFLYFAFVVIYLAIAVIVDHWTAVELDPMPNWVAIIFWWAVLPGNAISKFISRGAKK